MESTNLGFPRIGPRRELKDALERYWSGRAPLGELLDAGRAIRRANWLLQQRASITHIPSNDFSFYDHVLDACAVVGAVPERFGWTGGAVDLDTIFAMARGITATDGRAGAHAMDMTKWLDTNYHYIVPELDPDQQFRLASRKPIDEFTEALALGIRTRPVLLGPVSFLLLGKMPDPNANRFDLLDRLLPVYAEVLQRLAEAGAEWVQLDEPCLATDMSDEAARAYATAYRALAATKPRPQFLLATYFGGLGANLPLAMSLPVDALHVDLVRAPEQLDDVLSMLHEDRILSAGIVDGRNVWRNDLERSLDVLATIAARIGEERCWVAPSCSLMFVPVDLTLEQALDPEVRGWLAFATQKLDEIVTLARGRHGVLRIAEAIAVSRAAIASRARSVRVFSRTVRARVASIRSEDTRRHNPFAVRRAAQRARWPQPLLPTTTIGSFPQTNAVRTKRREFVRGALPREDYERFLEEEIARVIRFQEEVGLDVLVHGEPERNDMVQYFGEQLAGFAFTAHGWVQSYGSRYVRPPIVYGDVARPAPMTVRWSTYAQSLTDRPVKGMLTGPVTILQWSFVRDDQPRAATCAQIAFAIRDEVLDLERAGIRAIQIDEPALREGLPLRRSDWPDYLKWAVECFRIASSGVEDATAIHTHMCYSEFGDILSAIADLDADVLSIEASRSGMEILDAFATKRYPNDVGPGVYDIHSPRVPTADEIERKLLAMASFLAPDQLWVNPDCGLKTRTWDEVRPSLHAMVTAAKNARECLTAAATTPRSA